MRTIYNYKADKLVQFSDVEAIIKNYIYNEGCTCVVEGVQNFPVSNGVMK
ncbi:uncharacterized protein YqkB [Virgibacillus natechei]|uniref:Uncharacterized protein YqkB n=1 Tax=Virgibacillus natechei TaxID=1216297 RepID=A0ABS4IJ75_9BACI|nr:uncharacterized protein YqkB [Virgibacillus natechei]